MNGKIVRATSMKEVRVHVPAQYRVLVEVFLTAANFTTEIALVRQRQAAADRRGILSPPRDLRYAASGWKSQSAVWRCNRALLHCSGVSDQSISY